jgi:hypothetical protein
MLCGMRRHVSGLNQANASADQSLPDGLYLARVAHAQYRWHALKPYYGLVFTVLEPKLLSGNRFTGRLYCNSKALWKLNWFLRDFGYDSELLGRDEIDDKNLIGLCGVIKITHTVINGTSLLNLDGFAQASRWEELLGTPPDQNRRSEVAS